MSKTVCLYCKKDGLCDQQKETLTLERYYRHDVDVGNFKISTEIKITCNSHEHRYPLGPPGVNSNGDFSVERGD